MAAGNHTTGVLFVGLNLFSTNVYSCTCGPQSGDSIIKLVSLPGKPEAVTLPPSANSAYRERKLLNYPVKILEASDSRFKVNQILTGRGGGDCGVAFEAGREYTFRFWAKDFLAAPYLIDCQILKKPDPDRQK